MSKKSKKEVLGSDSARKIPPDVEEKADRQFMKVVVQDLLENGLVKNNKIILSVKEFEDFYRKTYKLEERDPSSYLKTIERINKLLLKTNSLKKRRIRDLSSDEMANIVKDYRSGHTPTRIAMEYGLGRNAVSIILKKFNQEVPNFQINTRINTVEYNKLRLIVDYTKVIDRLDFMGHSLVKTSTDNTSTSISRFLLGAAIDSKYNEVLKSIMIDYIACIIVAKRNLNPEIKLMYKKLINSTIFSANDELMDIKREYTAWLKNIKSSVFDRVLAEFESYSQSKIFSNLDSKETFSKLYEKGAEFSNNLSTKSPEFISRIRLFKSLGTIIDVPSITFGD